MGNSIFQVRNRRILAWVIFFLVGVSTWLAYAYAWTIGPYYGLLGLLAVMDVLIGIWLMSIYRFALKPILLLLFGLAVSQWWLLEFLIVQGVWVARGFAP